MVEIEGRIIQELPLQEGISKAGNPWKKKEWVLETLGQYPRKVKFTVFGEDRINSNPLAVGDSVVLTAEIESREYNERWYTDVTVLSSRKAGAPAAPATPATPASAPASVAQDPMSPFAEPQEPFAQNPDDLPF